MSTIKKTPTIKQFEALQGAYTYFNYKLFGSQLPAVILNLSRKSKAMGFAAAFRWREAGEKKGTKGKIHEISINPEILTMPAVEVYSTLVHEQVHIWQFQYGKPSRMGYHNREWANKMLSIGLIPSDTGKEGGKMTGQNMSDYPQKGGHFEKALKTMPKKFKLPFVSIEGDYMALMAGLSSGGQQKPRKAKKNKMKYTCPSCEANVWGKLGLEIICGRCKLDFVMVSI